MGEFTNAIATMPTLSQADAFVNAKRSELLSSLEQQKAQALELLENQKAQALARLEEEKKSLIESYAAKVSTEAQSAIDALKQGLSESQVEIEGTYVELVQQLNSVGVSQEYIEKIKKLKLYNYLWVVVALGLGYFKFIRRK